MIAPTLRDHYVAPTALEAVDGNTQPLITNLPIEICRSNILSYLGLNDLGRVSQVCRGFDAHSRSVQQRRARQLYHERSELFATFGIIPPGPTPSPEESHTFLVHAIARVAEINTLLPEGLRSSRSADDLVCTADLGCLHELLHSAHHHTLKIVFGQLAHVPEEVPLGESVRLIGEWLQTAEAKQRTVDLNLGYRCLLCVPKEIGQLASLQKLVLASNRIATLPEEIGQLAELQWLDLRANRLTVLPKEIGQLKSLQILSLSSNALIELPREIGRLAALRHLNLHTNNLTTLPQEIGQLTALQALELYNNRLTAVPAEIGLLTTLLRLDLGRNTLTAVPPEIGKLTAVHHLSLAGNHITELPKEIRRLLALDVLNLANNPLRLRPEEIGRLHMLRCVVLDKDQRASVAVEINTSSQ